MYKSQFQNTDPDDWFCGPGSHIIKKKNKVKVKLNYHREWPWNGKMLNLILFNFLFIKMKQIIVLYISL